MTVKTYRPSNTVEAEEIENGGNYPTVSGLQWGNPGDYLVYGSDGVRIIDGEHFRMHYEEVSVNGEVFHPTGNTVEVVVEYMRNNPEEIARVKEEELAGASRKGILEFN